MYIETGENLTSIHNAQLLFEQHAAATATQCDCV